jgi:hypothetical protein
LREIALLVTAHREGAQCHREGEAFLLARCANAGNARAVESEGILPGIKVDLGAKPLAGSPDELVTEGLDGLQELA